MFKITIDNEEVLCDKDFTIKEEMLNTSSVILNNVFPKTWEQDKDYVSRFYYPKDYSKCKIFEETIHPADPGITIENTSMSINYDSSKKWDYFLKGQTSQSGTPTPSSPQPINITTGEQVVSVCGKNLFDGVFRQGNRYTNGLNDTTRIFTTQNYFVKSGQTYTISTTLNTSTYKYAINLSAIPFPIASGTSYYYDSGWKYTSSFTFTPSQDGYLGIVVSKSSGTDSLTPNDISNINWQLEVGSSALPYEEYKGNDYEINLGKNLFDISRLPSSAISYNNGFTLIKGTHRTEIITLPNYCEAGTYTLSFDVPESTLSSVNKLGFWVQDNGTNILNVFDNANHKITFTANAKFNRFYFFIHNDQADSATITLDNIQLEKGNYASSFSPYKTPIYLGKIGTYQDYIFRNTTENPLYDSNLEEGQWYIHKEIGRVSSYNGETITTDYISTTGQKTTGATIYYGISATNTLIEDEELINQLNAINLMSGLNNISVSSANLPALMNLHYNFADAYTTEDLLFCGIVKNTGEISLNPRHPHYCNVQVLDFKDFLSQGETLDFVITDKTIEEAIDQVIGTIAPYGFIKGNIELDSGSYQMGAYSTKDKTAYDVFNYIADITQSRWKTRMIDENTIAIDFYDPDELPQGTAIEYTQTWFENNKIDDMSFSYSSNDYRNKQVMLSGEVYSNIETTEIIVADGYQTQFDTLDKIGKVSSIKIDGNPATIITKDEENLGYEGDFIFQPGNTYFESDNLLTSGKIITIVYFAIIEGREIILNQQEIERVGNMTNRKGIIARYENRNDATTTYELQQIGKAYLKYKGTPEINLKVSSRSNIWNIGDRVQFTAPLTELTTEYMVKRKTIERITTIDDLFYEFELTSSFNMERDVNYFDNQRYKSNGNIGEGEFISRNVDINNTANVIFYDLEVNEITMSGSDELQADLQAPLGVE